ncbi:MAG: uroporphyrinogen decarboxylase [Desulfobacterales bacterium]|nr:MAG: uroporphyrinogen decarboxylase [Desulfobacterales bacterium]
MKERFINVSADADQRQDERFEIWLSGDGIPFIDSEAAATYQERVTLIKDAIQLRQIPARIPICPSAGFFPIQYAGITMYDAMYDYEALKKAWEVYHQDLEPDAYNGPTTIVPGKVLDTLDLRLYQWPGHGVAKDREYQYVEDEYMKAEEYQDLIDDPTAFFLTVYFPRIFGALKSFETLPLFPPLNEIPLVPPTFMRFGTEQMQSSFQSLGQAGEESLRWRTAVGEVNMRIMGKGFPSFSGGFTKAPFDVIGDSLRGTKGVMLDMFRYPDELKEACERLTPIMVKCGAAACRANGHIMPFIPLHKGADGFMSDEQFRTFYWPTLRKLIIGLINEGMVPLLFAEGSYNERLDVICDIPKGKAVWWFDRTDMKRAKQTVGQVACLAGNMPLDLLCTGTPSQVKSYCKNLIHVAGTQGGFIFSSGAGMQGSKAENVKTMIACAKEYGVYK